MFALELLISCNLPRVERIYRRIVRVEWKFVRVQKKKKKKRKEERKEEFHYTNIEREIRGNGVKL